MKISDQIKSFWETHTCGTIGLLKEREDLVKYSKEYFEHLSEHRYKIEPWVHEYALFTMLKEKDVLEIGCGAGTDAEQFCKAGSNYTGIDLTASGVEHTQKRLEILKHKANIIKMSAHELDFEDNSFDFIFSWGVLHHSPYTKEIISEIYRVLRPGGKMCILMYNTYSWMSFKMILKWGLLRGELFTLGYNGMISKHTESADNQNPYTRTFTPRQCKRIFNVFRNVSIHTRIARADRRHLPFISDFSFGGRIGWHNIIIGYK